MFVMRYSELKPAMLAILPQQTFTVARYWTDLRRLYRIP